MKVKVLSIVSLLIGFQVNYPTLGISGWPGDCTFILQSSPRAKYDGLPGAALPHVEFNYTTGVWHTSNYAISAPWWVGGLIVAYYYEGSWKFHSYYQGYSTNDLPYDGTELPLDCDGLANTKKGFGPPGCKIRTR